MPSRSANHSRPTPSASSLVRSQCPHGSSPAPPASSTCAPRRAAVTATFATAPPKCGTNASASASEAAGRSQIRSTRASPSRRVRTAQTFARGKVARVPERAARHAPLLAAVVVAVLYVVLAPPTADLAAASFRADLFDREGFTVFSTAWYGGHHTPGYSVLFPPLGALLGVTVVGGLSA